MEYIASAIIAILTYLVLHLRGKQKQKQALDDMVREAEIAKDEIKKQVDETPIDDLIDDSNERLRRRRNSDNL